jgi:hypothetical protein
MSLSNQDIDELFDGKPSELTYSQWLTIEGNIDITSLTTTMKADILNRLNYLSEEEAEEIITKIYNNRYEKDPKKQWLKMNIDVVFKHRDFKTLPKSLHIHCVEQEKYVRFYFRR